jgi:hypothetical protein
MGGGLAGRADLTQKQLAALVAYGRRGELPLSANGF